ncbi:MAG: histidine phosphatase family protein [Kangiellaceae bacterium]|nr:histidine phosphatase family protein [Kangiellaceae bacterium]
MSYSFKFERSIKLFDKLSLIVLKIGAIAALEDERIYTSFLLVRHGETEWNKEQRLQGQLDSALTEVGIEQITLLADELESRSLIQPIDHIISSPLMRAQHSARILNQTLNQSLVLKSELKERSFGIWQGQMFNEIESNPDFSDVFFNVNDTPIPNGESAMDARERIVCCLQQLAHQYGQKRLLVVTHGELLRCFLSGLKDSIDGSAYQLFKNGKVFEVNYDHQTDQFHYINA